MEPDLVESLPGTSGVDVAQLHPDETSSEDQGGLRVHVAQEPEVTPPAWYNDPRYRRYWQHHQQVALWFDKHKAATGSSASVSTHSMSAAMEQWQACGEWLHYMSQISLGLCQYWTYLYNSFAGPDGVRTLDTLYPYSGVQSNMPFSFGRGRSRGRGRGRGARKPLGKMNRPGWRGNSGARSMHRDVTEGSAVEADSERTSRTEDMDTDTSFHMEITEDMIDFFAQSAKHRKERDAIKREDEENGEQHVEIVEVSANKNRGSGLAPSVRPGFKRTTEMRLLYGKGAAMIHGMETAMQLTYDRNCDLKQPKLWPHMPLNVKFDY